MRQKCFTINDVDKRLQFVIVGYFKVDKHLHGNCQLSRFVEDKVPNVHAQL